MNRKGCRSQHACVMDGVALAAACATTLWAPNVNDDRAHEDEFGVWATAGVDACEGAAGERPTLPFCGAAAFLVLDAQICPTMIAKGNRVATSDLLVPRQPFDVVSPAGLLVAERYVESSNAD